MSNRTEGNLFEYIIDHVNLIEVISDYIHVERSGKNYKALCPFHNEKSASFIISEEKQLYHCFGCGAAGNVITFIAQYENLDSIDAVEFLADKYRIDISQFAKGSQKNTSQHAKYYDILRDAAIFYYKNLRAHPEAMAYLERRGIHIDVIKQFGLGFSNDAWAELLKALSSKYSLIDLESVGLIIPNKDRSSHYDRFRNRIMFPIINPKGKIIGFGGRVMDDSLPKYLNSPETEVFNKSMTLYGLNLAKNNLHDKKQLIIAEGYMDVIALHTYGFNNAVATLGTALTVDHGRLMRRYADEVIICYDSDFAGQKATLRSLDVLQGIIEKIKVIVLGENLDPDDYLKKYGAEKFKEKIETAITATEYRLNHLMQGYNLNNDQEKVEFLSKASVIISELTNAFEKNLYVDQLSERLGVSREMIAKEVFKENYTPSSQYGFRSKAKTVESVPKITSDRKKYLEKQLITLYVHHHEALDEAQKQLICDFQYSGEHQEIMDYLTAYYRSHSEFSIQHIIEEADLSISTGLIEIIGTHMEGLESSNFDHVYNNLSLLMLDEEIEDLRGQLKTADNKITVQQSIQKKLIEKQSLTLKMRNHKLKN
ncbi:MAG: DNA primase [Firmicutes bacterium]|nr:DNA primase [Bacillota bacterium]